jgi:hypothetical protein
MVAPAVPASEHGDTHCLKLYPKNPGNLKRLLPGLGAVVALRDSKRINRT